MVVADWIKEVYVVKALGHLVVALAPFRAQLAGECANRVTLEQLVAVLTFGSDPELERTFALEDTQEDLGRRITNAALMEHALDREPRCDPCLMHAIKAHLIERKA